MDLTIKVRDKKVVDELMGNKDLNDFVGSSLKENIAEITRNLKKGVLVTGVYLGYQKLYSILQNTPLNFLVCYGDGEKVIFIGSMDGKFAMNIDGAIECFGKYERLLPEALIENNQNRIADQELNKANALYLREGNNFKNICEKAREMIDSEDWDVCFDIYEK